MTCCFCQQHPIPKDCTIVTSVTIRKQILRSSGHCFNCLRKGHLMRTCRSLSKYQGRHHTSIYERGTNTGRQTPSLHMTNLQRQDSTQRHPVTCQLLPLMPSALIGGRQCSYKQLAVLCTTLRIQRFRLKSASCLMVEPEILHHGMSQESTYPGALWGATSIHCHIWIKRTTDKVCPIVSVGMCLKGYSPILMSLYVVPTICQPLASQPIRTCIEHDKQLMGLDLADYSDGNARLEVDVLIGADYYWELVTDSICRSDNGPTAVHTKLGWVLPGPTSVRESMRCSMNLLTTHVLKVGTQPLESTALDEQLRSFWELESLGIHEEERTLYDDFTSKIMFQDGRYKVSLPWKEFHEPLSDNYILSLKRLQGLLC